MAEDRVKKGFSLIQIIAGLYPDMPAFDPRGANEAGFPWEKDYAHIVPAYFDMADLKIDWLVRVGLVPCIVGCWGYFIPWMGVEKMKRHWRNIVARWGAYPVVWCLAGEATMAYYLSTTKEECHAHLQAREALVDRVRARGEAVPGERGLDQASGRAGPQHPPRRDRPGEVQHPVGQACSNP